MTERHCFRNTAIGIVAFWLCFFVLVPNLLVLVASFGHRSETEFLVFGFSLDAYRQLFSPIFFRILRESLWYAAGTTLFCLLIAYPLALIVAQSRYKQLGLLLMIVPFWTNSIIRNYALIVIIKSNGLLNKWLMAMGLIDAPLTILYTGTAVFIGLVYTLLPFMFLPLFVVLEKFDRRLAEAGYDLGASHFQVLRHIIIPVSLPGILAGSIMVFLPALGLFYVPDLLGGAKSMLIGNFIKNQFLTARNWPLGAATGILLTVLMVALVLIYLRILQKADKALI